MRQHLSFLITLICLILPPSYKAVAAFPELSLSFNPPPVSTKVANALINTLLPTPLIRAIQKKDEIKVRQLLEQGADPNKKTLQQYPS